MKEPLQVAVLMGGMSAEREVSRNTGATVVRELSSRYAVKPVEILANGQWRVPEGCIHESLSLDPGSWFTGDGQSSLEGARALLEDGVDVVFNALHGPLGEDGTVQGFLRVVGLPFTGPDVIPAAVTMDKRLTKQALIAAGVRTPLFFVVRSQDLRRGPLDWPALLALQAESVPLPWVLKPNRLGSSVGVAIFKSAEEVCRQAQAVIDSWPALAHSDDLLVETALVGRELTCGVLETNGEPMALLPVEIRPRLSSFFDYQAKYTPGGSEEICPAELTPQECKLVQQTALKVHRTFECAPLSRTDMFLLPNGEAHVLEINTLPGMTATSLIPLSASRGGIALGDLLASLVEHALRRDSLVKAPARLR